MKLFLPPPQCTDDNCSRIFPVLNELKFTLGRMENRLIGNETGKEFHVFSQWGEDGIIQWLLNNISIDNKIFVEFGVGNYLESNTRFLLMNDNWKGFVLDGNKEDIEYIKNDIIHWQYNINPYHAFITAENINEIFLDIGVPKGNIGLMSIDIDGNDYWVWKAIDVVDPSIVIIEYNCRFGDEKAVTVPYDPEFRRFDKHYSGVYFGASIKALNLLGEKKGYALVAGNSANLFFVKKQLLNDVVRPKTVKEVYSVGQWRDSRDVQGRLTYASREDELKILRGLPVVDVENEG